MAHRRRDERAAEWHELSSPIHSSGFSPTKPTLPTSPTDDDYSRPYSPQAGISDPSPPPKQNSFTQNFLSSFLFWRRAPASSSLDRQVPLRLPNDAAPPLLDERTARPYVSNRIRTSRYTAWNFLPRQLIYQFSRLANAYFLAIAIVQTFPGFSTTGRFTTLIPLLIFVTLTICKEGYDDWRRYLLDKEENARPVTVLGAGGEWVERKWGELVVGDVVHLKKDELVPADLALLYADQDVAYVDTRALDGETTLKSKMVATPLKKLGLDSASGIAGAGQGSVVFTVEQPNQDLYTFNGTVTTNGGADNLPVNVDNILYRGCELKNTHFVVGLVLNTGEDTKIRMNANRDPAEKRPALEKFVDLVVITLAMYMLLTSLLLWLAFEVVWDDSNLPWYLAGSNEPGGNVVASNIIQFSNVVPMSLIMAIEAVKLNLAYLVSSDLEMYHEETDCPAGSNTNIILDDLGQIGYIFTDKTGTLTDNIMKFRRLCVAGVSWWHRDRLADSKNNNNKNNNDNNNESEMGPNEGEGTTDDLLVDMRQNPDTAFARAAYEYILALAVCHTCLPEHDPSTGEVLDFQASSPDELALVRAARELGILVVERTTTSLVLQLSGGRTERFEVLDVVEFSSKRKRMSIVVRRPDGRIWVVCKGADTMVLPLLKGGEGSMRTEKRRSLRAHERGSTSMSRRSWESRKGRGGDADAYFGHGGDEQQRILDQCCEHIDAYAREGLRTLVFAQRYMSEDEYRSWKERYHQAQVAMTNRQQRLEAVGEEIEHNLDLLGASGVEDKLQKGVPETIDRLRRANIKIWMLTGDKRETAVNIAHSSHICVPDTALFQLDAEGGDLEWQLNDVLSSPERHHADHVALVIDGSTLTALEAPSAAHIHTLFYRTLIPQIHSVICCRASPAQKALLVQAVRDATSSPPPASSNFIVKGAHYLKSTATAHLQPLTLAIGDGANDLAMITTAHIGIGISGREGQQAARVADISLAQFRYLARLLLVHGRWNYHRITRFILASFWKETMFWFPATLFQIVSGYTGTSPYESKALTVYGVLFTVVSTMALGAWEKDLKARTLMAVPELYVYGQRAMGLNWGVFVVWMVNALLAGSFIAVIAWAGYGGAYTLTPDDNGLYALGTLVFIACATWVNVKLL